MDMDTYKHVTEIATEVERGWSRSQVAKFHAFNPHGLVARKRANDERIFEMVEAGQVKSGWIWAYGSGDDYDVRSMYELAKMVRVRHNKLAVAIQLLEQCIKQTNERIEAELNPRPEPELTDEDRAKAMMKDRGITIDYSVPRYNFITDEEGTFRLWMRAPQGYKFSLTNSASCDRHFYDWDEVMWAIKCGLTRKFENVTAECGAAI